jgi:hypothetical protein
MCYFHLRFPGKQFGAQIRPAGLLCLDLLPQLIGFLPAGVDVLVNIISVTEVISDNAIHVREIERRIAVGDRFRFGAVVEFPDHDVEQNLRVSHAGGPMFVHTKGGGVSLDSQWHDPVSPYFPSFYRRGIAQSL